MIILTPVYNRVVKTPCTTSMCRYDHSNTPVKAIEPHFKEALFYTRYCNSVHDLGRCD